MSDIYLQITETPTVVTLSAPVISGALSSTVTVANTVTVALDSNSLSALENVTVTVGAAITGTVTVANFPSTQTIAGTVTANPTGTQTIAGTVTANVGGIASGVTVPVRLYAEQISGPESGQDTLVVCDSVGQLLVNATVGGSSVLGYDGYAYVSVKPSVGSSVTIGNSVTIGSLPAISGTVTANDSGALTIVNSSTVTKTDVKFTTIAGAYNPTDVASSYVVRPLAASSTGKLLIDASADSGGGSVVGYDGNAFIRVAQSPQSVVTVGSLPAISGTVTIGSALPAGTNQIGSVTASISGTVPVSISSVTVGNSVTIGNFPASQAVTFGQAIVSASNITALNNSVGTDGGTPATTNFIKIGGHQDGANSVEHIVHVSAGGAMKVDASDSTVTFGVIRGTVTVGNSVTIGSFATSVTARLINPAGTAVTYAEVGTAGNPSIDVLSVQGVTSGTPLNVYPMQGTTVSNTNFTSTTASTTLVSAVALRESLTVFNEGAGNLHISPGATCTTVAYQVRLSAGDYWECPQGQLSLLHSAVFATAGTARVCQVS